MQLSSAGGEVVGLTGLFSKLGRCKVAVAGDFLLDTYTFGRVERVSPEAPVPVVHVQKSSHLPGGAGNVVLNLISMGADVVAIGRVGDDMPGSILSAALESEGVDVRGMMVQGAHCTPVKNRVIAENQQVVRIDNEQNSPLPEQLEQQIIEKLPQLLEGVAVLAISDYGKGLLSNTLLAALIEEAKKQGAIVIADPKGIDYSKYHGVDLIKPNLSEAYAAAKIERSSPLEQTAPHLLKITAAKTLMVTRSRDGISLFYPDGGREDFAAQVHEVKDVTGAGDTVLAMLTVALANGLTLGEATRLCNVAASIAIEKVGCARVSLEQLARCLLARDTVNKVFDQEHSFALRQILQDKPFTVVALEEKEGINAAVYQAFKQLSQGCERNLIVYLKDENPSPDYVSLLASLKEVSFILLKGDTLTQFNQLLQPREIYLLENGALKAVDRIHALA